MRLIAVQRISRNSVIVLNESRDVEIVVDECQDSQHHCFQTSERELDRLCFSVLNTEYRVLYSVHV